MTSLELHQEKTLLELVKDRQEVLDKLLSYDFAFLNEFEEVIILQGEISWQQIWDLSNDLAFLKKLNDLIEFRQMTLN